ncbi:hypothetical protein KA001_02685 [Patescibacteria group bacterium]|nr:hypothetical protein [Patescibacteria group bacterium]
MELKLTKDENNVKEVTVEIKGEEYTPYETKALEYLKPSVELKGFRKGTAPLNLVKQGVSIEKLVNETFNFIYPEVVKKSMQDFKLLPIISPKVNLKKIGQGEFEATFIYVERPKIKIGDYKKIVKEAKAKTEIEVKEHLEKKEEHEGHDHTHLEENIFIKNLYDGLTNNVEVFLSDYLVDEEKNLMLERFFSYLKQLNITLDNYLESVKIKYEDLMKNYKEQAEKNLKREFAISEIGTLEKIEVTDKEVMDAINSSPDEKIKSEVSKPEQKLYIKNQIFRDKVIKFLKELSK